eukprot:CAMPEP_0201902436 /NCGR_PEP_ID=MMETSP0902-20130614/54954_1 /ASSEMBLY_ACC=CAM_ASM_000551 /TAXON_ID=420261 /ORGANISM="Thalassiosira antarctica, Strain CCMP982" /LENGTH=342 /DNA_ID=CAMNT_0048436437 /DNA_START=187 /DNA_END=1216 /DNA_ORIENTATION=-
MMAHQYQGPATMKYIPVHLTAFTTVKQSRKRLRFQPTVKVQPIDCRMTKEEKSRSYYSKNELEAFSLEVKAIHALSKNLPDASSACGAHATSRDCMIGLEADPALRGLERYLCPTRVRNKVLAQKALFKYHKQLNANPNQTSEEKLQSLAAASAKLSQWSNSAANRLQDAKEEKSRSYYSKNELKALSLEVKGILALSNNLPDASSTCTCGAHATSRDCMIGLEADPDLRGLDRYLCPTRVRNKVLSQKDLLRYHKQLNVNPNKTSEEKLQSLAAASAKLSQWSKLVAMETARLDSLRACEGDYLISTNDAPVDISPFPATIKRRRVTSDEDSQPAKRVRPH